MELREAIEELKQEKDLWSEKPLTVATILNAVADGTLIPADQCYEVREGYYVAAGAVDDVCECPLSEALTIRSAEDVRREVLGGWESIEAAKRVAYRAGYYQAECQLEEPDHIASSVDKWKEEVRRVTLEEAANAIEWKYNDATRDGILMWAHDEIRDLIDIPTPSTGKPCKTCKGTGYTDAVIDDRCGRCRQTGVEPDHTTNVVEAAQKVVDEYEDQIHGPVIYSIDELRDALAAQKGDE